MSYNPTLLIRKTSLIKKRKKIVVEVTQFESKTQLTETEKNRYDAYKIIFYILTWPEDRFVRFPEIELAVVQPAESLLNTNIRLLLDELDIDFRRDN